MENTVPSAPERLSEFPFRIEYEKNAHDLVGQFYEPALNRATHYDRAVAYFRSTVYHLIRVAIADFALRGGKMRLICTPTLLEADQEVIRETGRTTDQHIINGIARDIEKLARDLETNSTTQLLATLIEHGILDVRLTFKPNEPGIFHRKLGILSDGEDVLSWGDSANETYAGWDMNEEHVAPLCAWRDEYQKVRTERNQSYFLRLWKGLIPGLKTCPLHEVSRDLLKKHALPDPQEAIEKVRIAFDQKKSVQRKVSKGPKFHLQAHQGQSRTNWWKEKRGIISYVTGGGKTVTALAIIRDWFERMEYASAIVVVPTKLLAEQWRRELEEHEPKLMLLQVGGDNANRNWRKLLGDYTIPMRKQPGRVVLAVINSAAGSDFVKRARVGEHTLMVVDEVHRIGAPKFQSILKLEAGGRLGLSATPERYGDLEGTELILDYFGDKLEPIFTIHEGQKSDPPRLVPYWYYPVTVGLTSQELDKYRSLSKRIAKLSAIAHKSGKNRDRKNRTRALQDRAKILKGAEQKVDLAVEVIEQNYKDEGRWLVYCDDTIQLEHLMERLKYQGLRPLKYYSAMAFSKDATIERFKVKGGILLSINCLDEGIDIPSITDALILASVVNPRQHVQRRGRVLRVAENKTSANIYDALVQPNEDQPGVVFDQDLKRAYSFSSDAYNQSSADRKLDTFSPYSDPDPDADPWINFEEERKESTDEYMERDR